MPTECGSEQAILDAFKLINEKLGPVDVLVYNAAKPGSFPPPAFLELTTKDLTQALDVGVTGAFIAAQQVRFSVCCIYLIQTIIAALADWT